MRGKGLEREGSRPTKEGQGISQITLEMKCGPQLFASLSARHFHFCFPASGQRKWANVSAKCKGNQWAAVGVTHK